MTAQRQILFWSITFAAFLGLVLLFNAVLLPFVLGMVIAYLLNPLVNWFAKVKLGRRPAALIILTVFFALFAGLLALVAPVIYRELSELMKEIPNYIERLKSLLEPVTERVEDFIGQQDKEEVQALVTDHAATAVAALGSVAGGLVYGGQMMLHFISLIVITPIVAYFMMKEWPRIVAWIENILPRPSKNTILSLLDQIDRKLSGFIRGQVTVAFMLGLAYALGLSIVGLKYGFLIGILAGLLSIIPMVGSVTGFIVGVAVAWFQTYSWEFPLVVASIFIIGQIIEGNILTPKIVGDRVGLHPLWIFFALMAGASLFGFLGMLLAVPVAAVASVIISFMIREYKFSPFFRGPVEH